MQPATATGDEVVPDKRCGIRHVQVALLFLAFTISMAQRTNLTVAIVAIRDNTTSSNPDIPTYDWDNPSIILGAFFYSYIVLQIPAGFLSKYLGGKHVVLWSFLINTIACTLVPVVAPLGSNAVIAMRVIQGLAQGCLFPTTQTLLGRWAPLEERSTFGGIIYSGISAGSVIAFITSGYICSSSLGWPFTFYLWGIVGGIWGVIYFFLGSNSPAVDKHIKPEERAYIEQSLHQTSIEKDPKLPLKQIFTCIHFWAVVSANIGNGWIYAILMTEVSSYLGKVMKFNINSNGLVSSCPYAAAVIAGFIFSPIADCLIQRHILSRVNTRRLMQLGGSYGMSICLILVGYVAYTQLVAVMLLTLANVFYAASLLGYPLGPVDLSPRFAGVMYGISNTIGFGVAMFAPVLAHFIVKDQEDALQWRIVFLITGVLFIICATFYAIFISAERQPWDSTQPVEANT